MNVGFAEHRWLVANRALSTLSRLCLVVAAGLVVANCGQGNLARQGSSIDPKYGVAPSPRVVEDGQPVPKGGGREMVGKPYTIAGKTYVPRHNPNYVGEGLASWYGSAFHGRRTANGEVFDRMSIAAAHPTMPLPSYARVTNLRNKRSMIVRVNDRGPFHPGRLIDLSEQAAEALDFKRSGVARVKVEYMGRASTRGSDDRKLIATLRTDGAPAGFPGAQTTQFAGLSPAAAPATQTSRAPSTALALAPVAASTVAVPALSPLDPPQAAPAAANGSAVAFAELPIDLATIPHAHVPTPVAVPAALTPRSQVAGLFYAPPATPVERFSAQGPFAGLKPAGFSSSR